MTDKTNLIREIHEYVTAHGGENTATHLLVQAASAIQTQAAELEAVGAGGGSGPLMGIASISANAGEPRKVFLVATGEEHEGEATYTRYDDKPPPLCDSECLFATPPTAQTEGWRLVPVEPTVEQEWEGKQAALRGSTMAEACKIYKAMIAKAPNPPTSAEGVDHG